VNDLLPLGRPASDEASPVVEAAVFRKLTWRILPVLFI
jgi:hypothetical protein